MDQAPRGAREEGSHGQVTRGTAASRSGRPRGTAPSRSGRPRGTAPSRSGRPGGEAMRRFRILAIAVLLGAAGSTLTAHHSAAQFDFGKSVAINPHMRLVLRATDARGTRDVEFEGHSTNNMYRAGYRDRMIKVGDKIAVYAAPLRSGADGGYVTAATTASGQRFGPRSAAEATAEREKAEGK